MSATLVIDVTYRCNARCAYCRWGDGRTGEREHLPIRELCLDNELLRASGVDRVVLSGGEPLLHPGLGEVLDHYRRVRVRERVVITNGILATPRRVAQAHERGATGFAFSIDSVDPGIALAARGMTAPQLRLCLAHLRTTGRQAGELGLELTVNTVLSAANCELPAIWDLVDVAARAGATAIKFQPVFDDGYLGKAAPGLRLGPRHSAAVRAIGSDAALWPIATNSPAFFSDLARVCEGGRLDGAACGLGERTVVLQRGGLVVCPWIGARPGVGTSDLPRMRADFQSATTHCGTGPHCFCLQPSGHRWRFRNAVG